MEQLRPPARLVDDAAELLPRLDDEVADPARRAWLRVQLVALETHARRLAGDRAAVPRARPALLRFAAPVRRGEAVFAARSPPSSMTVVPGPGDLAERLAAWDEPMTVPAGPAAGGHRLARRRRSGAGRAAVRAARRRGAQRLARDRPAVVRLQLVRRRSAFAGRREHRPAGPRARRCRARRPRDVPRAPPRARLARGGARRAAGRLEASILLINTPECFISEGLAEVGRRFVVPPETEVDLLAELLDRAGLAESAAADREPRPRSRSRSARRGQALRATTVDAALMLHVDGRPPDDVAAWLGRSASRRPTGRGSRSSSSSIRCGGRMPSSTPRAPSSSTAGSTPFPVPTRPARFRRLLVEQVTPSGIAAEVGAG